MTSAKPANDETIKDLDGVIAESKGPDVEINWTMKLVHPDGTTEPDFITLKGHDGYVMFHKMGQLRELLHGEGWKEAQGRQFGGQAPKQNPASNTNTPEGSVNIEFIDRIMLTKRTDGKLELGLFGILKNKNPMEYPFLRSVLPQDKMKELLSQIGLEYYAADIDGLPVDVDGLNFNVHWVQGRATGKGSFYKDIVKLENI